MQSAWEIITRGQCNNTVVTKSRKPLTARQKKERARILQGTAKARATFNKLDALNRLHDTGVDGAVSARAEKRRMAEVWTGRQQSPGTFWKARNARPQ